MSKRPSGESDDVPAMGKRKLGRCERNEQNILLLKSLTQARDNIQSCLNVIQQNMDEEIEVPLDEPDQDIPVEKSQAVEEAETSQEIVKDAGPSTLEKEQMELKHELERFFSVVAPKI